ncbi:MAG: FliG C-terminal domain-containing protein [Hyphomicrobiaceae bacterium]
MSEQQSIPQQQSIPNLSGPERVAALLLALRPEQAQELLRYFDPDEVKTIARSVFSLQSLAQPALGNLIDEFAESFKIGVGVVSSRSQTEEMLAGVLTEEQISDVFADDTIDVGPESVDWSRFADVQISELSELLSCEHPQIVAYVLKSLGSVQAAKILAVLPDQLSQDIMRRLLVIKEVPSEPERAVWQFINAAFEDNDNNYLDEIIGILNGLEKPQVDMLLDELEKTNEKEVMLIRASLFSFEDLVTLTEKDCSIIFEKVPMEKTVLALSECEKSFQMHVLGGVGGRTRRMIDSELASGNVADIAEVKDAQKIVSDTALEMFATGQISRPDLT